MLKRVQHDREEDKRVGYRLIEGGFRSLQDDKERGLWVGRRLFNSRNRFLVLVDEGK